MRKQSDAWCFVGIADKERVDQWNPEGHQEDKDDEAIPVWLVEDVKEFLVMLVDF